MTMSRATRNNDKQEDTEDIKTELLKFKDELIGDQKKVQDELAVIKDLITSLVKAPSHRRAISLSHVIDSIPHE